MNYVKVVIYLLIVNIHIKLIFMIYLIVFFFSSRKNKYATKTNNSAKRCRNNLKVNLLNSFFISQHRASISPEEVAAVNASRRLEYAALEGEALARVRGANNFAQRT